MFAYAGDLPLISGLDDYAPSAITRVYASNGETLGEFATERRLVISYDEISPHLRNAIISAEDKDFNNHFGLSVSAMLVRLSSDLLRRRMVAGGKHADDAARAQPVCRRSGIHAWRQEPGAQDQGDPRRDSDREALHEARDPHASTAIRCIFGHGTNGVEAAARLYFGKRAKDVTLEEAAMIAGIIQTPARQSPYVNRGAAKFRRDYTLQQMAENGYITQEQADASKKKPIVTRGQPQPVRSVAPFFTEEVRKYLEQKYGAKALYESGLSVQTGIDIRLQRAANRAVDRGLRLVDKRRGYRRDKPNVAAQGQNIETYRHERWSQPIAQDDIVPAVVMNVSPTSARVRIGEQIAELRGEGIAWGRRAPPALFKVGDLIDVRVTQMDDSGEDCGGVARAVAARRRRARRHRQPHGPDSGDGRRLQLRSQQVQSRHTGSPAGGFVVQAHRLHRRHRSRIHAGLGHRRRTGLRTSPVRDSRRINPGTTTASTRGTSRCATRWRTRGTCPR